MTRKIAALAILILATACVPSMVATPPQEPIQIGFYSVTPQTEWNRPMLIADEIWTVDGYALQSLRFLEVAHGETLSGREDPDGKSPVFRKTMLPNEIQEFVVETLAGAKFGSLPGFRFSFRMVSEDGLEYEGVVLATVREDTLHLIAYMGTRLHYYPKHAKDVEKLFASIRT
jgi:hypothetical protein